MKYLEMRVSGVVVDSSSSVPMVILEDMEEKNVLPICIGIMEAAAILAELEQVEIERPMTHDLARSMLSALDATLYKITIDDLRDNVFYATVYLRSSDGETVEVDSRPSDAIALALRCGAPILVNEDVIFRARVVDLRAENIRGRSPEELTRILENMSAEDFGKYKM